MQLLFSPLSYYWFCSEFNSWFFYWYSAEFISDFNTVFSVWFTKGSKKLLNTSICKRFLYKSLSFLLKLFLIMIITLAINNPSVANKHIESNNSGNKKIKHHKAGVHKSRKHKKKREKKNNPKITIQQQKEIKYLTRRVLSFMHSSSYGQTQMVQTFNDNNKLNNTKKKIRKTGFSILFNTESSYLDNLISQHDSQNTGLSKRNYDPLFLAYSAINLSYRVNIDDQLYFNTAIYKTGYLGNGQLAEGATENESYLSSIGANPFYVENLFILWDINQEVSLQVGRKYFTLNNYNTQKYEIIRERDYLFAGYTDGVAMNIAFEKAGTMKLLLFDIFTSAGFENSEYLKSTAYSDGQQNQFKGDMTSFRTGVSFESNWYVTSLKSNTRTDFTQNYFKWKFQPFIYFLRYGAVSGSTERSLGGLSGAFTDNDYLLMYGILSNFKINNLIASLKIAGSDGIDRKIISFPDYRNDILSRGVFISLSLALSKISFQKEKSLHLFLQTLYSQGPDYNDSGEKVNYGFTSMQSNGSGGLIFGKFNRWKLTNQADYDGIKSNFIGSQESGGMILVYFNATFVADKRIKIILENWYFHDHSQTISSSAANESKRNYHNQPLGWESNLTLFFSAQENLTFYIKSGVFVPLEYFNFENYSNKFETTTALQIGTTFVY